MIEPSSPTFLPTPPRASGQRATRIRPRVIGLVLLTQATLIWWTVDSEIARSVYLICYSLMMPTVLYLLFARLLRRWLPFERHELLLGYVVLTATIPIIGFGGLRFLIPGMGFMPYFSETQPMWTKYLEQVTHLPLLQDPAAIRAFYRGGSGVPWSAWAMPIAFWSLYLLLLSGIWLGLAAVLHRIWIHQERLTFPITVLPLQLTDPRDDLFRRPLFWLGFAIPAVLQSLLALHDWFPSVPAFQMKAFDIKPLLFTSAPWTSLPDLFVGFYPMAVGLAYFVPSSVSFSCWFFWLLAKLAYVPGVLLGWDAAGTGAARFPYREEQAAGAWIAFAGLAVWGVRFHWASLMRGVTPGDRRVIVRWGLAGAACVLLCVGMMTFVGISPVIATGVIVIYIAYVLSGARVRAEAGGIWTFSPLIWTPHRVMNAIVGTQSLTERGILAGGYFDLIHVDIRAQSLPYLMEGLKIAEEAGIRWRTALIWVATGTVTALAMGWWSSLFFFHDLGAATSKTNAYAQYKVSYGMQQMDGQLANRTGWDAAGVAAMLFAGGLTLLLALLRMRLDVFPFHPVGYVLCNTLTMNAFFVPFFLAWLAKVLAQRFGGHAVYRRSLAFFVGLILGDIVTQAAWAVLSRLLDVPVYQFLS